MKVSLKSILFASATVMAAAPTVAQDIGFDPRSSCSEVLNGGTEITRALAASWTFGYLSAQQNEPRAIDMDNIEGMLTNLDNACANDPGATLLALVGHDADGADMGGPGSEAQVRGLLERFLQPGADLASLTAEILPTAAEIRAVYREPLSSLMIASYSESLVPGVELGPNPGQDSLLVVYATTGQLMAGEDVLRQFPGGYERVLSYLNPGFPIVRFKFVQAGETSGMAFDGLVYVNDHWVIMPKPWRMME